MVDYNLINSLDTRDDQFEKELAEAFGGEFGEDAINATVEETLGNFQAGTILKGKVVGIVGDDVVIDVGLKSEGMVPLNEWEDKSEVDVGDEVAVWLETVESDSGLVVVHLRKIHVVAIVFVVTALVPKLDIHNERSAHFTKAISRIRSLHILNQSIVE